jgi:hypothetical protein
MDQLLIAEILTSDSDEIADLKANIEILDGLIELARQVDALPNISKRFFEESRSLYQATSVGQNVEALEKILSEFFGPPVKPAGKPLPRKMRNNSSVNYLGGIQKDQSLFLISLKTGEFYGALWPWKRNKDKIEIHLGYCSDWITDEDYGQIEMVVKRSISRSAYSQIDTGVGGQIHGISLPSFLQMAEMERSTFTLRVSADYKVGRLYLSDGNLIDAELMGQNGWEAACNIISWENTGIEIEPADYSVTDVIKQPLMHILMESLRVKDEARSKEGRGPDARREEPPGPKPGVRGRPAQPLMRLERVKAPQLQAKKKISFLPIGITLLILVCILSGVLLYFNHQAGIKKRVSENLAKLLNEVDKTGAPGQKLVLLEEYIKQHPNSPNIGAVQNKMLEVKDLIETAAFDKITLEISTLEINEHYEKKAIALYGKFLEEHPNSRQIDKINKSIGDIKKLLDQYYYNELKRAARLDFAERTKTYRNYLSRFPKGRFRKDVEILIEEMGRQYLEYIQTETAQCDQEKQWKPCIENCDIFLDVYKGMELSKQASALKAQIIDKRDLYDLAKKAERTSNDYQAAYNLYRTYLAQHPQSSQYTEIEKKMKALESKLDAQGRWKAVLAFSDNPANGLFERIQRLDAYLLKNSSGPYSRDAQNLMERLEEERQAFLQQRQAQARQQEQQAMLQREKEKQAALRAQALRLQSQMENQFSGASRFRSNGNGTVTDTTTNLIWTILDTHQELGGCLTYDAAIAYTRELAHGGYTDWRLPTASELAAIYKQPPYFPASGAQWYWSSESYVKGFHTMANIVTAKPETVFERAYRPITECGSVRAVRP